MTDYKSTIAELNYLADWAKHHLDKAKIANDAADAIEALQAECAEHKENAIRNARIAVSIRAERDQLQSQLDAMGKLVPVDPTPEMREAGLNRLDTLNADPTRLLADRAYFIYRAMLAAAPEQKQ